MGFKKILQDPKGQSLEYHRIISCSLVFVEGQEGIHVNLAGYTNKTFRDIETADNDMKISNTGIILPLVDEKEKGAKLSNIYARIKAEVVEFEDAEDILEETV